MGSSCVTIPTLTTTSVQVVRSTETTINTSTSVAPPQTTVFTSRSVICSSSSPSTPTTLSASASPPPARPPPSCTTDTLVITSLIPGSSATFQVTETKVVSVTNSNVNTLFSTSCTAVASSPNSPTPPSSTTSTTSTTVTSSTSSTNVPTTSQSTSSTSATNVPTTSQGTSSTSATNVPTASQGTSTSPSSGTPGTSSDSRGTPPDPSVTSRTRSDTSPGTSKTSTTTTSRAVVITATSVATITGSGGSAITLTLTSTFTSSSLPSAAAVPGGSHTLPPKIGAIVGGSVGGFLGFIALVFIISLFLRRRPKWDHDDEPVVMPMSTRNGSAPALEPTRQPYEYGRVGQAPSWDVVQTSPPVSTGQSLGSGSPSNTYPSPPIVGLQQYHSTQQVGPNQGQTLSRFASTSSGSHYTQPSLTSQSSRTFGAEQVPDGPLPTPDALGGERPIVQNGLNIGRNQQGQPGPSSVNQGIGATEDGSAAGPSGAGYYPGTVVAPGHMSRPSASEFDAYQEHQPLLSPWTAQRDGNGQGLHLDGGQYTERPISSTTAPPAYTS